MCVYVCEILWFWLSLRKFGYYFIDQAWNIEYNLCLWSIFINSAWPSVTEFNLCWYSMFIILSNFRFWRNCGEIEPCQTSNMELFMKVVTFLTKPFPTGKIYVRGIFVEHSLEIFLVYLEKIPNEIPGNILK